MYQRFATSDRPIRAKGRASRKEGRAHVVANIQLDRPCTLKLEFCVMSRVCSGVTHVTYCSQPSTTCQRFLASNKQCVGNSSQNLSRAHLPLLDNIEWLMLLFSGALSWRMNAQIAVAPHATSQAL
jgi:hypothetical protein